MFHPDWVSGLTYAPEKNVAETLPLDLKKKYNKGLFGLGKNYM